MILKTRPFELVRNQFQWGSPADTSALRVKQTVSIAPATYGLLECDFQQPIPSKTVVVIPNNSFIGKTGLAVASAIVVPNEQSTVPVCVYNTNLFPFHFFKGVNLAAVEELSDAAVASVNEQLASRYTNSTRRNPRNQQQPEINALSVNGKQTASQATTAREQIRRKIDFKESNLTKNQQQELLDVLNSYNDLFSQGDSDFGKTGAVKHNINTGNAPPIKQHPYRVAVAQRSRSTDN